MVMIPGGDFTEYIHGIEVQYYKDGPFSKPQVEVTIGNETFKTVLEDMHIGGGPISAEHDLPQGRFLMLSGKGNPPRFFSGEKPFRDREFDVVVNGTNGEIVYTVEIVETQWTAECKEIYEWSATLAVMDVAAIANK